MMSWHVERRGEHESCRFDEETMIAQMVVGVRDADAEHDAAKQLLAIGLYLSAARLK